MSATSTERTPSSQPRITSSIPYASWSAPRSTAAGGRRRLGAEVPAAAGVDEEADLDPVFAAECHHLLDLRVGEEHHAAALADAVNLDPVLFGRLHDRVERSWAFDRRDLHPALRAVREALVRVGQFPEIPFRQPERGAWLRAVAGGADGRRGLRSHAVPGGVERIGST
ncbi:hypothetical protein [Streptomyces sp. NPDC005388]|uniref:hypothetical protein n=1 Tax=Streptomyces sp. NPDC005388 TaxID=3156717 RepID=UPI0033B4DC49